MSKRYLTVITVLFVLVGCFFLFFDKPTSKELYNKYFEKIERRSEFNNLEDNNELNIQIDHEYINNQYHSKELDVFTETMFSTFVKKDTVLTHGYYELVDKKGKVLHIIPMQLKSIALSHSIGTFITFLYKTDKISTHENAPPG